MSKTEALERKKIKGTSSGVLYLHLFLTDEQKQCLLR